MSLLGESAPEFELESTAGGTVTLSDTLDDGSTVVLPFRGTWCSFCQEQLQTFSSLAYDMHRHQNVDVLPLTNVPVPELVAYRDRHDLRIQVLSDPGFEVTETYSGVTEHPDHGEHTRAATYVVDTDGVVRYEHLAEHSADRTYANTVRYLLKNDYEDVYFGRHDA